MKRRILALALCLLTLFFVACAGSGVEDPDDIIDIEPPSPSPAPSTPAPTPADLNTGYNIQLGSIRDLVQDYGESEQIAGGNDGGFSCRIMYPLSGGDTKADEAVHNWAQKKHDEYADDFVGLKQLNPDVEAELNIDYDSYIVRDNFAGVLEFGYYYNTDMAHSMDIMYAMNIDLRSGQPLLTSEIFDKTQHAKILGLLKSKIEAIDNDLLKGYEITVGDDQLKHAVIMPEGVGLAIERGTVLPAAMGPQLVILSYEELGSSFIAFERPAPTEKPAPTESQNPEQTQPPAETPDGTAQPSGGKPKIGLSFDDGPAKATLRILDTLKKYNARATFCVVGNRVSSRIDIVKAAISQGCEIATHTWDHKNLKLLSKDEVREQIKHTIDKVKELTGYEIKMLRPPYGNVNDTVKEVCTELGVYIANWSIDTEDWKTKNAQMTYDSIMKDAKEGAIILCHDLYQTTADAMERVIAELSKKYDIVPVFELLGDPQAGHVYRHK